MTGQLFEYQGRLVSVLELAELVLAGPVPLAVVEADPVVAAAPPPPVEQVSVVIIPKRVVRRLGKVAGAVEEAPKARRGLPVAKVMFDPAGRIKSLWDKALARGIAYCGIKLFRPTIKHCSHCRQECVVRGRR